jgi:hypothetical protein
MERPRRVRNKIVTGSGRRLWFCPTCRKVWDKASAGTKSYNFRLYKEIPSYGLDRRVCPDCAMSSNIEGIEVTSQDPEDP